MRRRKCCCEYKLNHRKPLTSHKLVKVWSAQSGVAKARSVIFVVRRRRYTGTRSARAAGAPAARAHVGRIEFAQPVDAGKPHAAGHLVLQQLQHAIDSVAAGGGHAESVNPADADHVGAERDRLDHVGAAAEAAVDDDLGAAVTAATISGSMSMVPRPWSSCRPPWFDT